jgi:hypothetical protein
MRRRTKDFALDQKRAQMPHHQQMDKSCAALYRGPTLHHQQWRSMEPWTFQSRKEVLQIKTLMERQFIFKKFDLAQLANGVVSPPAGVMSESRRSAVSACPHGKID